VLFEELLMLVRAGFLLTLMLLELSAFAKKQPVAAKARRAGSLLGAAEDAHSERSPDRGQQIRQLWLNSRHPPPQPML